MRTAPSFRLSDHKWPSIHTAGLCLREYFARANSPSRRLLRFQFLFCPCELTSSLHRTAERSLQEITLERDKHDKDGDHRKRRVSEPAAPPHRVRPHAPAQCELPATLSSI